MRLAAATARRRVSVLWRDPRRAGLLMGVYFLLSLATGPGISVRIGTGTLSRPVGWVLLAFLVWRVTRGGRISRMLLLLIAGGGFIAGIILLAIGFSWPQLGLLAAGGAQVSLLLSPAVYQRTRPADHRARAVARWRSGFAVPLVLELTAVAVLGLAGVAASAAVISSRVSAYHSETVRVLAGHPVVVTLSPGRYDAFGGCLDEWGCAQLSPRDLSVLGALSGPVSVTAYGGFDAASGAFEQRTEDGQPFVRELAFTVGVRQAVRIALSVSLRPPVLIAPSQEETSLIRVEVVAAIVCGLLLLGSLAALAWPVNPEGNWRTK